MNNKKSERDLINIELEYLRERIKRGEIDGWIWLIGGIIYSIAVVIIMTV